MNGSQPVLKTKGRHAMNIFDHYRQRYEAAKDEEFTLQEFLTICRQDRSAYANAAERLLMAIGEPVMVDTALELAYVSLCSPTA
jgi:serine protein kinase